jgi:hypothetical protein
MAAVNAMDAQKSLELAAAEGGFNHNARKDEEEKEASTSSEGRETPPTR